MYKRKTINNGDDFFIEDGDVVFDPYPPKGDENTNPTDLNYYHHIGHNSIVHSKKWNRLKKINKWLDKDQSIEYNMKNHFDLLISYFDITTKTKNFIKKEVFDSHPTNIHQVIIETFKSIVRNNFHITTKEFRNIIRENFKIGKGTFKNLWKMKRDYTWYINKVLSNLDLTPELYHKLYTKVKENFEKLRNIIPRKSTALISVLCRLSYKTLRLNKNIPSFETFLTTSRTYTFYRDIFKEMEIQLPKGTRTRRGEQFNSKEYHKKYYMENKDKIRKQQKEYQERKNNGNEKND